MRKEIATVWWVILGILVEGFVVEGLWCDRTPTSVNVPKTSGDNGFKIVISGDPDKPDKYIPGAVYTVRLQGKGDQFAADKFLGFLLVAEPTDGLSPEASAGNFQLTSDSLARFSEFCPHAVKHASELPKAEVQVRWIAPPVANGCVSFRATIIKNKGQWFMDDGELTKQLCPETEVGEVESEDSEPCCACDEAKYELTFEGLWSPLTHPKDFPADAWSAHFSDIVGASHSPSFRFWQYNEPASEGLRHLAEAGDSKDLERELKDESGNIRTIIKARGLRHPNFFGHKTFAVFRADKDHNLISLVSKIAPSPDWFVGVSGLNLCLRNCSWTSSKVIPLYPWDAGTDSGISYLSEKEPTIPRDRIRRIVWKSDKASPFYEPSGNMVKPFARLRIQKQRAYERPCDEGSRRNGNGYFPDWEEEEDSEEEKSECAVTPWTDWTSCTATCGKGVMQRRRQYLDLKGTDSSCNRKLTQATTCDAPIPCNNGQPSSNYNGNSYINGYSITGSPYSSSGYDPSSGGGHHSRGDDPCAVSNWTAWAGCSKTCGQGIRRRRRDFVNPSLAAAYSCEHIKLVDNEQCFGAAGNCNEHEQVAPGCDTTEWGEWGSCSVTLCGRGIRTRHRMYAEPQRAFTSQCNASLMDTEPCMGRRPDCDQPEAVQEICTLPMDPGPCGGSYVRWYFESQSKTCMKFKFSGCQGNRNMFEKEEECEETCGSLKEESYSEPMMRHQSYGYGSSLNHLSSNSYSSAYTPHKSYKTSSPSPYNDSPVQDCVVSDWGPWGKCSVECGGGHKYRIRYVKRFPQNGGKPCPKLEHRRKCKSTSCPPPPPPNPYNRYQQYGYYGHDAYVN